MTRNAQYPSQNSQVERVRNDFLIQSQQDIVNHRNADRIRSDKMTQRLIVTDNPKLNTLEIDNPESVSLYLSNVMKTCYRFEKLLFFKDAAYKETAPSTVQDLSKQATLFDTFDQMAILVARHLADPRIQGVVFDRKGKSLGLIRQDTPSLPKAPELNRLIEDAKKSKSKKIEGALEDEEVKLEETPQLNRYLELQYHN